MVDGGEQSADDGGVPTLVPDDGTSVVRSGGRLKWIAAFAGAVALVVGLVVVVGQGDDVDAGAALEKAQAIVEGAESYRFEVLETRRTQEGDPDGAGTDTTTRYLTTGAVADPDHWHVVESDGYDPDFDYEVIRDGATAYSNASMGFFTEDEDVDVPEWVAGPVAKEPTAAEVAEMYAYLPDEVDDPESDDYDPVYAAETRLDLAMVGYLLPLADDPEHVKRLVADAVDPVVEEELADGGLRLRTRLAPVPAIAAAAQESDQAIPPVDLLLDLDAAGRPRVARFTAEVEGASQDVEVRYLSWDEPVTVAAPAEPEVDRTPWLPEEQLAAHPELLVVPAAIPEGWALGGAFVAVMDAEMAGFPPTADEDDEDAPACRSLELQYVSEAEMTFDAEAATDEDFEAFYAEVDVLAVSVGTPACVDADSSMVSGVVAFGPGGEEPTVREVRVDGVVVTISTTLGEAELDSLAASVRRVTIEELAAMFPPDIADEQGGLWLGGPFG